MQKKTPNLKASDGQVSKKKAKKIKSASYDERKKSGKTNFFSGRVERHCPRCADPSSIVQQEPDESVFRMSRVRILEVSVWCFGTKISQNLCSYLTNSVS